MINGIESVLESHLVVPFYYLQRSHDFCHEYAVRGTPDRLVCVFGGWWIVFRFGISLSGQEIWFQGLVAVFVVLRLGHEEFYQKLG